MRSTLNSAKEDWIALAEFGRPHGVRGQVLLQPFTAHNLHDYEALLDERGQHVRLRTCGQIKERLIVAVEGITTREQAATLRGKKIGVPRASLPPLTEENRYYYADLIGSTVQTADGTPFGILRGIVNYGASDILQIECVGDGSEALFAFNHATFPEVDVAQKRIVICPPEILAATKEAL